MKSSFYNTKRGILTLCAAAALAGPLFQAPSAAVTRSWVGGTGEWNSGFNWAGGVIPLANDEANIIHADGFSRSIAYNYGGPSITLQAVRVSGVGISANAMVQNTNTQLRAFREHIGIDGRGSYIHSAGNNILDASNGAEGLSLGLNQAGIGTYNLLGNGVLTILNATAHVGHAGQGTFIHSAGTHSVSGGIIVGTSATGSGTYLLSGSGVVQNTQFGYLIVGRAGTGLFDQTGGAYNFGNAVSIGESATGKGTYQFSGGAINAGTLARMTIGFEGAGTFIQSGGTFVMGDSGTAGAGLMVLGAGTTGVGNYIMSGGTLRTASLTVGSLGLGTFHQSAGTHVAKNISLGGMSSAAGTYTLSGNGMLNSGSVRLGGAGFGGNIGGTGNFVQTGGVHTIGNAGSFGGGLDVGGDANSIGNYQLSGGTLIVHGFELVGGGIDTAAGTFNQTGGTHSVNGVLAIGGFGGSGTYLLSGGRLVHRPVSVASLTVGSLLVGTGGTLVGGDGVVDGLLVLGGGAINGTLRNEGTLIYDSGTFSAQLLNSGTVTLKGKTLGGAMSTNEEAGIIEGPGGLTMPLTNNGLIDPNGVLSATQTIQNAGGVIEIGVGDSFRPNQVNNTARIAMAGGVMDGTGNVVNGPGGVISGGGTIRLNLTQNGGTVRADDPNRAMRITAPVVMNSPSQFTVFPHSHLELAAAMQNTGTVALGGAGAQLSGATITNAAGATIGGSGHVSNRITNRGVIRAENGALVLGASGNTNEATGQIIATSGGTVSLPQGLTVNAGTISLFGGAIDTGGSPLTSTGRIIGRGSIRAGAFNNSGTTIFSAGVNDVIAPLINSGRMSVTGNAVATFFNDVNTAAGTLNVNLGSTAVFLGGVSGVSRITGGGVKNFEGTVGDGVIQSDVGTTVVGESGNVRVDFIRDDTLNIVGRAAIDPASPSTPISRVNNLILDGQADNWVGRLDLTDSAMVVNYSGTSPIATIANQIRSGFADGSWNGTGISSSVAAAQSNRALGFVEASSIFSSFPASFLGVSVDNTSVLVRYTLPGDADLDGAVNIGDFALLASSFNQPTTWFRGDFNYDGTTDIGDFALLAVNFNRTLPADLPRGSAVPEPAAGILALAAGLTLSRIRRSDV